MTTSTIERIAPMAGKAKKTWKELQEIKAQRAKEREDRFEQRRRLFSSDPDMDPRRLALYLDRTLINSHDVAQLLGITAQRVYELRKHGQLPEIDVSNDAGSCIEIGRIREWAERESRYVLDLETGDLIEGRWRHGRARDDRSTTTRPRKTQDE